MTRTNFTSMRIALGATLLADSVSPSQAHTIVNGNVFTVQELVGVGRIAANLRDEHGKTFASISGLVADRSTWTRSGNS